MVNELVVVWDDAERVLDDDGASFGFEKFFRDLRGGKRGGVDVGLYCFVAADDDGVDGGDAGVGRGDDFAGAELVFDGAVNFRETEALAETQKPIVWLRAGDFCQLLAYCEVAKFFAFHIFMYIIYDFGG